MSSLIGNPEDRVSHDNAHIVLQKIDKNYLTFIIKINMHLITCSSMTRLWLISLFEMYSAAVYLMIFDDYSKIIWVESS